MPAPPTAPAASGLKVPVPTSAPLAFETSFAPIANAATAPTATSTVPIRAPERQAVETERQQKAEHDRRDRRGGPDDRRGGRSRPSVTPMPVASADADDREDEDLDRRGRHPEPVEEGRHREGDADHDDLPAHRERPVGEPGADPLLDRMARERRAEERERRHEERAPARRRSPAARAASPSPRPCSGRRCSTRSRSRAR